jgi:phosphohistidine swiveling domain-containing protein
VTDKPVDVEPWPFDLPGDPDYPMYMRGQAEEVLPGVLTPLMCTFGAPIIEAGWSIHVTQTLPTIDPPRHPHTFIAVMGGRTYMNLSVSARGAVMSTGTRAEDFAQQFDVGADFIAAARRREGDDERAAYMQAVIGENFANPPREMLAADRASANSHREDGRARRSTMAEVDLLARARLLAPEATIDFSRIMLMGTLEAVAFAALNRGLEAIYGDEAPELVRALLSGIGDVDSALPAQRLTALAKLDGVEYERGVAEFLDEYGYRGANEFELSAPSWEMAPEAVHRMVQAARTARAKDNPTDRASTAHERLRADGVAEKWPEFEMWLRHASFYVAHRESAKATFVIVYNEIRRDLFEIGRRLVARGQLASAQSVFLFSRAELEQAVSGGDVVSATTIDERAAHMEQLDRLVPPSLAKVGEVPPLDTWELKEDGSSAPADTAEFRGVPGSPGTARGRVRVVLDPYEDQPPEPGEILVAPFTDPGWTLMFMAADAVVVEVGGALSHAVVVARELGIPAVVSVEHCCDRLHTGDLIEVDGSTGIVRVLERNA